MRLRKWPATLAVLLAVFLDASAATADETAVELTYEIFIAGIRVGQVDAVGTFVDNGGYALALRGYTDGVSRLVSDASAELASNGFIRNAEMVPATFEMAMMENGIGAYAEMLMRGRTITNLTVVPGLLPSEHRVPLTLTHTRDVVDPMSGLIAPIDDLEVDGAEACNRRIKVFDGWQRFDVVLDYASTETVFGTREGYSGDVFVCSARYVPVAGHRSDQPSVMFMAENERLEARLVQIPDHRVLVPYQILIGTEAGDLVVRMVRFRVDGTAGGDG
ncbi:MAG: DUF3108 domain-containing protein [Bauldia sp.]|nr:DUF3108 domain-containing protein [Bauldia sp.]